MASEVTTSAESDRVDGVIDAWRRERPDIDVSSIAVLTRALLIGRHLQKARDRALHELGTDTPALEVLATLRRAGAPYRLRTSEIEAATSSGRPARPRTVRATRRWWRSLVMRSPKNSVPSM